MHVCKKSVCIQKYIYVCSSSRNLFICALLVLLVPARLYGAHVSYKHRRARSNTHTHTHTHTHTPTHTHTAAKAVFGADGAEEE
jgi:hypothetical protein